MTDPRPFHIGSEVCLVKFESGRWSFDQHKLKGSGKVYGATGMYAFVEAIDGSSCDHYFRSNLVHASDGAPLGEFVPISEEAFRALGLAWDDYLEPHKTVDETLDALNALIRGEAEDR